MTIYLPQRKKYIWFDEETQMNETYKAGVDCLTWKYVDMTNTLINPYPANVENRVSS